MTTTMNRILRVGRIDEKLMFDMHSHILWDMDDGSKTVEDSIAMGSIAYNEGVHTIVATPHLRYVEDVQLFLSTMDEKINFLMTSLNVLNIHMDIVKGAEVYADMNLLESEYLTELGLGGSRYILIEFPSAEVPHFAEYFMYELQLKGFIPVIAHPERNGAIIRDPNILYNFVDAGCLSQVTSGSLNGIFGSKVQECARILLTHDMVHMIGTDAHSVGRRGPYMKDAREKLINLVGEKKAYDILYNIPILILNDENIEVVPPIRYKKKKKFFGFF